MCVSDLDSFNCERASLSAAACTAGRFIPFLGCCRAVGGMGLCISFKHNLFIIARSFLLLTQLCSGLLKKWKFVFSVLIQWDVRLCKRTDFIFDRNTVRHGHQRVCPGCPLQEWREVHQHGGVLHVCVPRGIRGASV